MKSYVEDRAVCNVEKIGVDVDLFLLKRKQKHKVSNLYML